MLVCGVDVGARTVEAVVADPAAPDGTTWRMADTGHEPAGTARRLFDEALAEHGASRGDVACTVATGYGRASIDFATRAVTEITCHARGVRHVVPDARTIVDIGGQDSKVIVLDEQGAVTDFAMNDRCAAGTGRFLEMVARLLELDVADLAGVAEEASRVAEISSLCAVFAETEVVGLLARGTPRAEVVAGVHASVASRVASLAARLRLAPPGVFTGGVARNAAMGAALE
ncbi:MAG: acyl-CoA dehydratase activase, partial [Planctomycetota bacterium]